MMARIRLAMPVIEAGLVAGHTLRTMHQCLNQDGIPISYKNLSLCRRRILLEKTRFPCPADYLLSKKSILSRNL